ncbi:patatin-like phospholipase family protein [Microcoleus sp. LAD1_D5]|uniref:patatin-like phospholipase family protein n=1 Tax=unclassified Microcoleus TaxID=2642155 RepID=UPI002FD28935
MAEIDNRHKLIKRIQRISNWFENKLIQISDWFENKLIPIISNWFEDQLNPIVKFLIYLRVPLTVAIAAWYFFTQIDQTIEVYLAIALDSNELQAVVSTVFVVLLSLVVWFAARSLEKRYKDHLPKFNKKQKLDILYKNAPRLLGAVPLGSLAYGTWATTQKTLQDLSNNTALSAYIFLLVWMFSNIVLLGSLFYLLRNRIEKKYLKYLYSVGSKKKNEGLFGQIFENIFVNIACFVFSILSLPMILGANDSRCSFGVIAVFLLLVFSNVGLYSWQNKLESRWIVVRICFISVVASLALGWKMPPTFFPDKLGSISVVAISLTIVVVVFSTIYHWGKRTKIPGITILIGLMLVSSALNLNDNHRFQLISKREKSVLPTLESSFNQWLENRPDRAQFSNKPYPVYIAAAQGGGIYAAYHAATAFSKLTEYFPNFPQHVFAISGVSGGSLGASAFSSLVKVGGISGKSLSQTASKLFSSDLLTPLLTMGLFPDLVQRFIFFPIDDWDRARGLEVAFEKAWDKLSLPNPDNPLRKSFYEHWQPQGKAPALVLNTTVVETGDRLVISPFQINLPNKENIAIDEPDLNLKLSTAAGLSARFPYFTPVGWYQSSKDKSKLHLADGGYFDNSGIPTALDIGRNLQQLPGYGTTFEIVYLSLIDGQFNEPTTQLKSEGLNELLSPVRALFSARESRSRSAVELSMFTVNDEIDARLKNDNKKRRKYKFRTLFLNKSGKDVKLPLGWLISKRSREFIDLQTPDPNDPKARPCDTKKFQEALANGLVGMDKNHNLCVIASIGDDLRMTPKQDPVIPKKS